MIKVFTAFSGYDSQCMALQRLGIDYELVGWSEIDKYAIQAHNAIFPQWKGRNFGDICCIDWNDVPDFDLFTYSFPCTDISSAGHQRGLEEGSETRSSLLWECRKAIENKKPKYLLMENVKSLTSKKFLPFLHKWIAYLDGLGYSSYAKVLNAKDYGIPQNRERIFVVSILGDEHYQFPKPFELKLRLKDVLESNVDEKYYLSPRFIDTMRRRTIENKQKGNGFKFIVRTGDDIASVVKTRAGSQMEDNFILDNNAKACCMVGRNPDNPTDRTPGIPKKQIIEVGGDVANCITTVQKDSMVLEPNVPTSKRTEYGKKVRKAYETGEIQESKHNMTEMHSREDGISNTITTVQKDNLLVEPKIVTYTRDHKGKVVNRRLVDVANTIHTSTGSGGSTDSFVAEPNENLEKYRIRKLTPRECFRLMGVTDEDINKIQSAGISQTQQYKIAGNSIVVDVLYYIFENLLTNKKSKNEYGLLF